MALPLPRVVADVGPGGGLVTAMGGINSLHNDMLLRKINEVKAQYAPLTTKADAASKLAYANLMGPQFLAKLLGNTGALGNLSEDQKRDILGTVYGAGTGQGSANNIFSQMQNETMGPGERFGNSLSGFFADKLKSIFGGQAPSQMQSPAQSQFGGSSNEPPMNATTGRRPKGGVTIEGQQWYDKNGNPVYEEDIQEPGNPAMQLELTKGQRNTRQPTYAENEGLYKGTVNQGAELGTLRAKDINEIGHQQLQLSQTGANLDRLVDDFTNPDFVALREQFPFLQDTQLNIAAHTDNPQQRYLIGKIIADIESFKGSTVNGFKGQTLKREFDYADKLKPSTEDTVYTALGKLESLKALKEIAWKKNQLINRFLQNDKMNLSDAVEKADKMVDIKAIDKQVKDLTQPMITLKNSKTGMHITVTKSRAKELGVKNV